MGDFSRLSNFNPNANYKFVRIGADCPVLEIELNEMQQISEQRLQDIVKNFIGDGVKGVGSYAYSNGTLTVSDEEIIIDGIPLKITTLKLPIAEGERAYIQMWLKEVTYQDTLKYMGNVQETRTIENKILDTNIGSETSRRMQMQYDLVKDTNQRSDLNPVNLYIGTITGGKFVLDAPLLKTYTNTKHVQKFLVTQNQTDFQTEGAFRINSNALEVYVDGVLQLMGYDEDYIEVASNLFRFNTPVRTGSEVIARYSNAIQSESRPNTHGSSHNATGDDPIDISDLADRYGVRDKLTKSSQVLKDLGTAIDKAEPLVSNINSRLSDFHSQNDTMQKAITTAQGIKNDLTTQNSNAVNNKNGLDSSINNAKKFIERLDDSQNLPQMREDINSLKNGLQVNQSLAYKGTDLTCENSLEGRTSNMLIKGQTYQNLAPKVTKYLHNAESDNDGKFTIIEQTSTSIVLQINSELTSWRYINCGKVDINMLKANTEYTFCGDFENIAFIRIQTSDGLYVISDFLGATNNKFKIRTKDVNTLNSIPQNSDLIIYVSYNQSAGFTGRVVCKNVVLLEGDWTNKEVPNYITGIESVGEQENNKISILSKGKNLCPVNKVSTKQARYVITKTPIPLKPNTYYSISSNRQLNVLVTNTLIDPVPDNWNQDVLYSQIVSNNKGYEYGTSTQFQNSFLNKDWKFAYITTWIMNDNGADVENLMFCEGQDDFYFVSYKGDKKEILLPIDGGLKSLPNGVADTIEQREDGVYLVQRVDKTVLNGSEPWIRRSMAVENNTIGFGLFCTSLKNYKIDGYGSCDRFNFNSDSNFTWNTDVEGYSDADFLQIRILKSKLKSLDETGFKDWLKANPTTFYYELDKPVETKLDIKDINLETYDGVTYVTCQTNILPEITFSIPSNLGSLVQNNAKNINDIYKLLDEVLIPQITQNALDIDLLKVK